MLSKLTAVEEQTLAPNLAPTYMENYCTGAAFNKAVLEPTLKKALGMPEAGADVEFLDLEVTSAPVFPGPEPKFISSIVKVTSQNTSNQGLCSHPTTLHPR